MDIKNSDDTSTRTSNATRVHVILVSLLPLFRAGQNDRNVDVLKRKLAENPDGIGPPAKKTCTAQAAPVMLPR